MSPVLKSSWAACPRMPAVPFVLSKRILGGLHVEHVTNALCQVLHLPAPLRVWMHSQVVHPFPTLLAARMLLPCTAPSQTDLTLKAMHLLLMSLSC